MAVIRAAGKDAVRLTWNGATVLKAWEDQIQTGMDAEADEVLDDLHASIHEVSGDMRRKAFARVEVRGTKRTLVAGSDSGHAVFEELEPNNHPVIRTTMDRHIPHISQKIAAARRGR